MSTGSSVQLGGHFCQLDRLTHRSEDGLRSLAMYVVGRTAVCHTVCSSFNLSGFLALLWEMNSSSHISLCIATGKKKVLYTGAGLLSHAPLRSYGG